MGRLPPWFKQKSPDPGTMTTMKSLLSKLRLHTICENALCPNVGECFCKGTATFLILGDTCTRRCTFCAVKKGVPGPLDEQEPRNLLEAVETLDLNYVVITSVTRDDLPDGGASHFARTVEALLRNIKSIIVEILVPDFAGSLESITTVVKARPHVINHNIETVPRLYPEVRPIADYRRSVDLLHTVKKLDPGIITKSGLMLGLGETKDEVVKVMEDLREAGCELLTLGQYLQPSPKHHDIIRFVSPEEFSGYEETGEKMGFAGVASAPLVRSSFKAAELFARAIGMAS